MRGRVRWLIWAVALSCAISPAMAQQVTLNAEALRKLAYTAMQTGYAEAALEYTDALLLRDPDDGSALVIRSQALRALGRTAEAKAAAQAAWDSADSDPARFGASMAMAQALSTAGRRTAAQWWLRTAAQNAPNARAEARAQRDFAYVKSRNPWDVQFSGRAAPSSNVNNGSRQDTLTLAGLPFEFEIDPASQALSGFETGFGLSGTYRFSPTGPLRQTSASFGVLTEQVVLSGEAKALAPSVSGADFAFAALEVGLAHKRALDQEGRAVLRLAATGGHNWYGGAPLSDYLRLGAGLDHNLGQRAILSFDTAVDRVVRIDSSTQSSDRVQGGIGYTVTLDNNDQLLIGVIAARVESASAEIRNESVGLTLGWAAAEPVAGIGLKALLGVESRFYDDSAYVLGGREDVRITATLSMQFSEMDYLGFAPVLDLQAVRNRSNAALYDSADFGISLGIKSSF